MTERRRARPILTALAALAAALTHAGAQTARGQVAAESSSSNSPMPGRPLVARKIDEFGSLRGCDHSARLDNFAVELEEVPGAVAYLIAYGTKGEGSGAAGFRLRHQKGYLVNARGIADERVKTVYGGPYAEKDEAFSELWVVPPGAEAPKPAKYRNDAATFRGKFAEYEGLDGDFMEYDPGTGPPVGNTTLAGFAEVLRLQPALVAYVVAYNGEDAAPGAWRRVAERDAGNLKERYALDAARVKVLYGGDRKETTVRLWALPKDAPPPVSADRKERRPRKGVKVVESDSYSLKYEEGERETFRGFAEVLKADEQLNLCLVVWPDVPTEATFDPDFPADPDEPPDVDLVKLVESWRARLAKEYRVGEHRVTVLVVQPREDWEGGRVEAWVVPPGSPLPDPSARYQEGERGEANP